MSGNLPPGCTDAHVDAAAPQDPGPDPCAICKREDCETCDRCGECVQPCSCYDDLPPSSPLDPMRSGDANAVVDTINGIRCELISREPDDYYEDLFVVDMCEDGIHVEAHVYLGGGRPSVTLLYAEELDLFAECDYRNAARKFVAGLTDDYGEY